eukprot:Gb_28320 [translate_table: standard]
MRVKFVTFLSLLYFSCNMITFGLLFISSSFPLLGFFLRRCSNSRSSLLLSANILTVVLVKPLTEWSSIDLNNGTPH